MKNYPILVLFLLFILPISNVFSQRVVEGKILSEAKKQSLPYAMIQGVGENTFVYSDEQGNFRITISDSTEKLAVTSSGFQRREITVPLQAKKIAFDIALKATDIAVKKEKKPEKKVIKLDNSATVVPNGQPQPINLSEIREKINNSFAENSIEGNVSLRILVDEEGKYIKHIVLNDVSPTLVTEVEKYIKEIRFAPLIQNGKAMKFSVNVQFNFKLE